MSPQMALASDIFRLYMAVAVGLLLGAGTVLAVLRWGLHKDVHHAWQSYRGWLIMVPVILLTLFLGRLVTIVFLTILALWGFQSTPGQPGSTDWVMTGAVYVGILVGARRSCLIRRQVSGWYGLFIALPVYIIALLLAIPVRATAPRDNCKCWRWRLIISFISAGCSVTWPSWPTPGTLTVTCSVAVCRGAERCGRVYLWQLMGRRPFRSNISPNKTWEGAGRSGCVPDLAMDTPLHLPAFQAQDCILVDSSSASGAIGDLALSVIKGHRH